MPNPRAFVEQMQQRVVANAEAREDLHGAVDDPVKVGVRIGRPVDRVPGRISAPLAALQQRVLELRGRFAEPYLALLEQAQSLVYRHRVHAHLRCFGRLYETEQFFHSGLITVRC